MFLSEKYAKIIVTDSYNKFIRLQDGSYIIPSILLPIIFCMKVVFILVIILLSLLIQGGPTSTLVKAEVPWSARRGSLSEKDRVLKTVKG